MLARALHEKMEHLDPGEGGEWENLSLWDRDFYVQCVEWLLGERAALERALELTDKH